ncbi:MAG: DUF5372 family protein [Actinomycetota bacterium]
MRWSTPSIAPDRVDGEQTVRVAHPFHPWRGQVFALVGVRHTWGEDRVFFLDEEGVQRSLPTGWTDVVSPDVFVAMAEGRCHFRTEDLLTLTGLLAGLREGRDDERV